MAIFAEITENECINDRHLRDNEPVQCSEMTEVAKGLPQCQPVLLLSSGPSE